MFNPQISEYLIRRQRKDILEDIRRVAVVGMSPEPIFKSYGHTQKLIQYGMQLFPVIPNCRAVLGLPCYDRLEDVPGDIDLVDIYRQPGLDLLAVAQAAIDKKAKVFWIENDEAPPGVRQRLADAEVFVVEHESLEAEYRRHCLHSPEPGFVKPASNIRDCMTRNPVTVTVSESLQEALTKMKKGHFRHLPVIDSDGHLAGMLSDRDLRLIRPFSSPISCENPAEQLATISVEEVAVFSPVAIMHDASLEEAAEMMLRWGVGALPVLAGDSHLVGIITYSDLLKQFLALSRKSVQLPQRLKVG